MSDDQQKQNKKQIVKDENTGWFLFFSLYRKFMV